MNRLSIALFLVATSFFITSCSNQLVQSPSSSPALGSDGIINALADLAEIEHDTDSDELDTELELSTLSPTALNTQSSSATSYVANVVYELDQPYVVDGISYTHFKLKDGKKYDEHLYFTSTKDKSGGAVSKQKLNYRLFYEKDSDTLSHIKVNQAYTDISSLGTFKNTYAYTEVEGDIIKAASVNVAIRDDSSSISHFFNKANYDGNVGVYVTDTAKEMSADIRYSLGNSSYASQHGYTDVILDINYSYDISLDAIINEQISLTFVSDSGELILEGKAKIDDITQQALINGHKIAKFTVDSSDFTYSNTGAPFEYTVQATLHPNQKLEINLYNNQGQKVTL